MRSNQVRHPSGETMKRPQRHLSFRLTAWAGPALGLLLACDPGLSSAQTSPASEGLQEIVVTAQRRAESLSNVPVSVSAYDRDSLDQIGAKTVEDVTRTMPGIIVRPAFEGTTTIAIRGISSVVGAGTTGIYIDDTPIQVRALGAGGVATSAFPRIFDLERVEVLRGPQGTLFGSGSEGGTIRFITPSPLLDQTSVYSRSEVSMTDHGDPNFEQGIAVGAPIVADTLGFRASAYARRDGGWVDLAPYPGPITDRNINAENTLVANLALGFRPFAALTITPGVYYQRVRTQDVDQYWPQLSDPARGQFVSGQLLAQPGLDRLTLPSLKIQWELGAATLYSNTSYLDRTRDVLGDYSFIFTEVLTGNYTGPHFASPTQFQNPQTTFTQEIRLQSQDTGRVTWLVGAFYQDNRQKANQLAYAPQFDQLTQAVFGLSVVDLFGIPLLPGGLGYVGLDTSKDTQEAVFGDAGIHLTDSFSVDLGLRVAHTKFSFTNFQNGPINGGASSATGSQSQTPISPKVSFNYKPDDSLLVYASAAKGFRPGGANTPVPEQQCAADLAGLGLSHAPTTYDSDTVWSYEVGSKTKALNGRLLLDGSAFYVNWKNIQNVVPLSACGFSYVGNLGNAVSKGFDLQGTLKVVDGLLAHLALGYTNAKYSHTYYSAPGIPLASEGDRLDTPPWHASLSTDYSFGVPVVEQGYLHLQYDFDSAYDLQNASDATYDPLVNHVGSTRFMSARLGLRPGRWDVSVFADNLLDYHDTTSFFHDFRTSELVRYTALRPRVIGVTASFKY